MELICLLSFITISPALFLSSASFFILQLFPLVAKRGKQSSTFEHARKKITKICTFTQYLFYVSPNIFSCRYKVQIKFMKPVLAFSPINANSQMSNVTLWRNHGGNNLTPMPRSSALWCWRNSSFRAHSLLLGSYLQQRSPRRETITKCTHRIK